MSGPYIVASKSTQGVITDNLQYATVEDALRSLSTRAVQFSLKTRVSRARLRSRAARQRALWIFLHPCALIRL